MLTEYVRLCGRIPMLPRYTWGPWFSRYWEYTDSDLKAIVERFRKLGIPLDVLVVDVDWHKYGWEGYDWNEELFPDWPGLLAWLHEQGVYTTLNNHPGSPLPVEDTHHAAAAAMAGLSGEAVTKPLAWDLANKASNRAFVEAVHWPLEEKGVDFWWIDGAAPSHMRGLDSSVWCAKTYYDGTARRSGKRSLTFSRYGDLGQHRYPTGFSGDVYSQWEVLDYEVPFTLRAGNVAFPYWSHDIGGFHGNKIDTELYVRWCQFGVFSPVLRLHSNHGVREPWEYGEEAEAIVRDYFRLRERLYPYLNSCQREVNETGMPLCRPMYLQWPDEEEAYDAGGQYMLGPELLVAPVTTPAGDSGVANKTVWIPPGLWHDYWTQEAVTGPTSIVYQAPLDRCPLFARAGGVVPLQSDMQYNGQKPMDALTVNVWSGADGLFTLYEDDGLSMDYLEGGFATTIVETRQQPDALQVAIGPTKGVYEGAVESRAYLVVANGVLAPSAVRLNGQELARRDIVGDEPCWVYDEEASQVSVLCPQAPVTQRLAVVISAPSDPARLQAVATLRTIRTCAREALGTLAAAAAPRAVTDALQGVERAAGEALHDAVSPGGATGPQATGPVLGALKAAWQAVGSSSLPASARDDCLARLVGLSASANIAHVPDSTDYQVRVAIGSRVAVGDARLATNLIIPNAWLLVDTPSQSDADFGNTGAGSLVFPVRPPSEGLAPHLGMIELGAQAEITIAGVSLRRRLVTGFDCTFVQQWRLIGPFANTDGKGLETVYPPEERIDFGASYPGLEGEARWQETKWRLPPAGADPAVFINLEPRFRPKDRAIAYAVTHIIADEEKDAVFSIGTDDGCKVWLNGQLILEHPAPRPPAPGQDQVPVTLHKGRNTVMMKVTNEGGQWGLYLQVTDKAGKPLTGVSAAAGSD